MEEIICAGTVTDFKNFIDALHFPESALFLAEEFPRRAVTTPAERRKLLRFDLLSAVSTEDRQRYTSGRIFTREAELRWEKQNRNNYEVVYFGPTVELVGMNKSNLQTIDTDNYKQETKHYYLFGTRVHKDLRERMELHTLDDSYAERLYAEARIPRLLHYPLREPAPEGEKRVQLEVLEYREIATGHITFYRFQGVKPAE
ncbi:MAG TPA: CRISPR-associated protein Csx19 [Ktedonobacteraceae bacterium]|jgi:hypothetical protein|nr:CRISPR-associated protein Csx19 [Ktedonobacteraceae bacterium]